MSSPYVVFENRPLDEWKVTELKEELKKRNLITKGLKDDLVKRLDEAIRAETEETNHTQCNDVSDINQPDDITLEPVVSENITTTMVDTNAKSEILVKDNMTEKLDTNESLEKDNMTDNLHSSGGAMMFKEDHGSNSTGKEDSQVAEEVTRATVSEVMVSEVKSDSISINTMSVTKKIELKGNVIASDGVKLELDFKPDGKTGSVVVDDIFATEEKDVSVAESVKRNDSGDVGSPEKLNLDRSSGDDSMEEDALESKQIDAIAEITLVKDGEPVDVMVDDTLATKTKGEGDLAVGSIKRKLHDQEAATTSEVMKRQRINTGSSLSTTPENALQASKKHGFLKADSSVSREEPEERTVPPSAKPPTTSLRIDRFLRPFTLKAVQQLLGRTGTVVSFWMDHIKTHCYVTYSSVEEAVETRNAVYNLQWPVNGGRLLVAEFVDPSEVKSRTEAPPLATSPPPLTLRAASARKPPQQVQLPPPPPLLPLPPPPPLPSHLPPPPRDVALPPPPPLPVPVVTLDDLFRKTRATPRIYYLPLSEEQVAAKLKTSAKQQ